MHASHTCCSSSSACLAITAVKHHACDHSCASAPPAQGGAPGAASLKLRMHHSSVLARVRPQWVVFHSVQQGDSSWHDMQGVTVVQPEWLLEAAPHMFSKRQPVLR